MNRNTPRLSIAARRRIVDAVQRIERPMSRRVVGNAALNEMTETACSECGYLQCSCPPCSMCGKLAYYCGGTCAEGTGKPAEPSPAGGRDPYEAAGHPWARVGMRVRVTRDAGLMVKGRTYVIEHPLPSLLGLDAVTIDMGGHAGLMNCGTWCLEPAPSPVSEAPTAESDEAVLKRCGWHKTKTLSGYDAYALGTDQYGWTGGRAWPVLCLFRHKGWCGHRADRAEFEPVSPTLLQAACAALGIELECDDGLWLAFYQGNAYDTGALADAESCARAALEAWSRRHG